MSTKRLFHYKQEMSHDCRVFRGNRGFVREIPELPTIKRNFAFNRGYQKCPNSRNPFGVRRDEVFYLQTGKRKDFNSR